MGDDWSTLFNVNELKMIRSEEKHSGESESSSLEIIKQVCPFRFGKLQLEKRFHRQSRNELSILSPEHIQAPKNRNDSARQKLLIIPNFLRSPNKIFSWKQFNSRPKPHRIGRVAFEIFFIQIRHRFSTLLASHNFHGHRSVSFHSETQKISISRHFSARCVNHLYFHVLVLFFDDWLKLFSWTKLSHRKEASRLGVNRCVVQKSDQNWQRKEKRNRKLKQIGMPSIRLGFYCFFLPLFIARSFVGKKSPRKYLNRRAHIRLYHH